MTDTTATTAKPPDLQEWVAKYRGYPNIPWHEWDAASAAYQTARRERMAEQARDDDQI